MIDPTTAALDSNPLTADVRSGYRSPPMTMIIGKTGPVATPANAKSAIEAGNEGTTIAAASATDIVIDAAIANRM